MFGEEPVAMVARTLMNYRWVLRRTRSDFQLLVLMEKISTHLQLDEQTIEHKWTGLYDLKGRNLIDSGKVRRAVHILEQVVKIREQTLVEEHPLRLAPQHALAGAYRANGYDALAGPPVSTDGTCSSNSSPQGATCAASAFGDCCSEYGYCGGTNAYCGTGCQAAFGTCA